MGKYMSSDLTLRTKRRSQNQAYIALLKHIAALIAYTGLQASISERSEAPGMRKIVSGLLSIADIELKIVKILDR
jgi:hypothetical protein